MRPETSIKLVIKEATLPVPGTLGASVHRSASAHVPVHVCCSTAAIEVSVEHFLGGINLSSTASSALGSMDFVISVSCFRYRLCCIVLYCVALCCFEIDLT